MEIEVNNEKLTPAQRFWRLLKPDASEIRNVYIYAGFNGLIALSLPLGIQAIVNFIQGGMVSSSWILIVCLIILGVAATGILQIFQLRIIENLQQKIFTRAAFEFAYRIPRVRMESMYNHYAPELMNRFFDVVGVQKGLSKILVDFSAAGLQMFFGLLLLSFYHPFFIIFSITLVLILFAIFRLTWPKGLKTSLSESRQKYRIAHWLEEVARTFGTFKLGGKTDLPLVKVNDLVDSYISKRESHFKILLQQYYLMVFFKVVVISGLLAIGGILVMEQHMNIGQFIAAEVIVILIINSVEKLIMSLETVYDVLTSLEKIGQVTDLELENNSGVDMVESCKNCGVKVQFNDVTFYYPDSRKAVLRNVNFTAPEKALIGITGSNGAGKSTMLKLIAGFYDLEEGSITYNEMNRSNLQLDTLRDISGYAMSTEELFEGTIHENISVGRRDVSLPDVIWAIEKVGLDDYIRSLNDGINTIIQPQGKKVSSGIQQRLILARAVVTKPKLLLLDNALEHLNNGDKTKLVKFLTDKNNSWTLIASTNDPEMLKAMDQVIELQEGEVIKQGAYK